MITPDDYFDEEYYDDNPNDFFGPNNTEFNNAGYFGHGFDGDYCSNCGGDMNEDYDINFGAVEYDPVPREKKLEQLKKENPGEYDQIFFCLITFARNRHLRLLKKMGESCGLERHLENMSEDFDAGYYKIQEVTVKENQKRIALFEFDPYSNKYTISIDSVNPIDN